MTHKQWFNNVLHLHPVHEEGAGFWRTHVYFLEIFTSFNLKMMTSSNKTWLTAF